MIEVIHAQKSFGGFPAVADVSFSVERGRTMVLLGSSGSGKTTLLKLINRLIEPSAGEITIDGTPVKNRAPEQLRRGIGYVIQRVGLFPHLTVAENVAVVPGLLKWDKRKIAARTETLLEMVGLTPGSFSKRFPAELSGGEQQRVGLARALAADPPVVLLDEPFGALDPITRRRMQEEFKRLKSMIQKTMVLVTHDVEEAFELGDVICLLEAGRVIQTGSPRDLLFRPESEFVRAFFEGSRLSLEMRTLTLRDLLPALSGTLPGSGEPVPAQMSVWAFLSRFDPKAVVSVTDVNGEVLKVTSPGEVWHVFFEVRSDPDRWRRDQ